MLYGGTRHHTGANLKGAPATPDHVHWVSSKTNAALQRLLSVYKQEFAGAGLKINDISLPTGGRFEAITQETVRNATTGVLSGEWSGSHTTHEMGIDVDVGLKDTAGGNTLDRLEFLKKHVNQDAYRAAEIHGGNHVHIYFNF